MDITSLEIDYRKLGMRLREQRLNKQFTQEKVAELAGFTLNYYQRCESNNAKPSLTALVKICQVLGCSLDYVLCDTLKIAESESLNLKMLSEIEIKFISHTIKHLKELELDLLNKVE